jgi:hypothetical protein
MTFDELESKTIGIKKRGLNILVENELIARVRKEYYDAQIEKQIQHLSNRFRQNVRFLNRIHGEACSAQKIKEFMGVEIDNSINKTLYEEKGIYSLKQAYIVAEFFGLPAELLLFNDLEVNYEHLSKEYSNLFKQNRG